MGVRKRYIDKHQEFFTCADCGHPYAIVGEHDCRSQMKRIADKLSGDVLAYIQDRPNNTVRVLEAMGKSSAGILNSALGSPRKVNAFATTSKRSLSELANLMLRKDTTHDQANDLLDEMRRQ